MDIKTIGFVALSVGGIVTAFYKYAVIETNKRFEEINKELTNLKIEHEKIKGELNTVKQVHDVFNKNVLSNLPALFEALKHKTND